MKLKISLSPMTVLFMAALIAPGLLLTTGCESSDDDNEDEATFTVTIDNLSGSPTPISRLDWAVHTGRNPFFIQGTTTRLDGLESLAEDGDPTTLGTSLNSVSDVVESGITDIPSGSTTAGSALPGSSFTFTFNAREDDKLSFVTMYVESNDLFFSPGDAGINLFPNGEPLSGDITDRFTLYDAGTEVNQQPREGSDQAPRQIAPNTGASEDNPVQPVSEVNDGFTYPAVNQTIRVTISSTPK